MLQSIPSAAFLLLLIAFASIVFTRQNKSPLPKGTRRPPGPKGKPFLGNLDDAPTVRLSQHWKKLSDQYGPVMRLKLGGQEHIVLSNEKVANDLLRERGTIYSSREQPPAVAQLLSNNMRPLFLPYNGACCVQQSFSVLGNR